MTNNHNHHTLNHYVKSPEARFLIRTVAFVGYIVLGIIWWGAYLIISLIHQFLCDLVEIIFLCLEGVAAARYKLQQLHKKLSYFEMTLIAIGTIAILTVLGFIMYGLMFAFTVIIPPNM